MVLETGGGLGAAFLCAVVLPGCTGIFELDAIFVVLALEVLFAGL